jgi:hypothetical protein
MTAITQGVATAVIIAAWSNHSSMTKQVAAKLARELALLPAGTRVESSWKIAANYGVSPTMAANARHLLTGAKLVHKAGTHYFTGQPETEAVDQPGWGFSSSPQMHLL